MSAAKKCVARVERDWHDYPCDRTAKHDVEGIHVCGVHKKVAERWQRQGRLHTMAEHWWLARIES